MTPAPPLADAPPPLHDAPPAIRPVQGEPRQMPCPQCGHPMPDLKGGKASICTNCGYKDSCCY